MMALRGWKSKETLQKALRELEHFGMIIRSRQGGRKSATLYAVTFQNIHDCQGKLDIRSGPPPGNWKVVVTLPVSCSGAGVSEYVLSTGASLLDAEELLFGYCLPGDLPSRYASLSGGAANPRVLV